jgi:hypothetical protein
MNAPHAVPLQVDPDHPWPGLASYDESSQEFFNGRASEIDELVRRVLDEPMTVLFGKSGLGKSSLLMAGLFPKLRSHDLLPVYVRLQFRPNEPALIDQVKKAVVDELELHQVEHPPFRDSESLWEYLHRSGLELWSAMNRLVRPVLVFDQFEEVFTLGQTVPREVERFRRELADLAENRLPPAVAERLEKAAAINSSLDIQAMTYKIVVSLREDFLADLEGWRAAMPSLRRNRMRLLPMGPKQATAAILNDRTKHLVEPNQARRIVAFLSSGVSTGDSTTTGDAESGSVADGTVEPALLSLFCRGVNEQRIREGKKHFDDALLERGKEGIVADFYRDALADQLPATRKFIEEQLITEHGFRNSYSVVDARQHGYLPPKALDDLVDRRLLRREHYHGTERVELTHDLLTRAVLEDRDRRRQAERSEIERRRRLKTNRIRATSGGVAAVCLAFAA